MGSFKISLAIFCFILLAIFWPSRAQNSQQDYLDGHNAARAQVGVGPIAWDNKLVAYAQNYSDQRKNDCQLMHSGGPYGENLAEGGGDFTARDAVNLWVNERQYYDYNSNSCAQGKMCGHYTQVVWRNSLRVGCARVKCTNSPSWFVICSYDPPGNYIGQRPY